MQEDEKMLEQYKILVEFLGKTLGPNYEVVLHDAREKGQGVIAIENGRISGRKLGAPITDKMLHMIEKKEYEKNDYALNYTGQLKADAYTRSSTMFIKNSRGRLIGLLCVNFDDSVFKDYSRRVFNLIHPAEYVEQMIKRSSGAAESKENAGGGNGAAPSIENFHSSADDLIADVFNKVADSYTAPLERLTQEERTGFIAKLNEYGIFRVKGSVQYVSERLGCSSASIYRYLAKVGK